MANKKTESRVNLLFFKRIFNKKQKLRIKGR